MEPGLQMGEIGQQSAETAPVDGDAQWNVKTILRSGQRVYDATRILLQNGFNACNLAGSMMSRSVL